MTNPLTSEKRRQPFTAPRVAKLTVLLVLASSVLLPLVRMFTHFSPDSVKAVITNGKFPTALLNSLLLTAASTVIAILLAYLLAVCMERTDVKGKTLFSVILVLPMLIPSISHGMGLIILFGQNGIFTRLFGIESHIYGPVGIILGSVMYAFPVAYIMLADLLRYEDRSVYEAADVLGIRKSRQFFKITLPYLRKPLISAVFSTFAMIVTDYGVPLMIGGKTKTVSLLMYEEVIGQLDFGRGCFYGIVLLIPAVIAFLVDLFNKDKASSAFIKRSDGIATNKGRTIAATIFCTLIALFTLLPLFSFLILAFSRNYPNEIGFTLSHLFTTLEKNGAKYLLNSLLIALFTALSASFIAYISAYITARMKSPLSRVIHLLLLTFLSIPGIVLGLSYLMTFTASPLAGTLVILVMVNTVHFISSPYLMMYNTFGKMNENLEAVGRTMGIGRIRMLKDVFLPQSFGTLLEMFSYLFVNCMMTISAVSFLATRDNKPLSLLINQYEAQSQYEAIAVVSLLILAVNVLVKALVALLKKHCFNYSKKAKAA